MLATVTQVSPVEAKSKKLRLKMNVAGKLPGAFKHGRSNNSKFYNTQGIAFDTTTEEDAYAATLNNNRRRVKITHMKYTNGKFKRKKSRIYTSRQLGHANDLTVYNDGKEAYIFIAKGGDRNSRKACMIKASEFEKGKKRVYKVKFNKLDRRSGGDLRGIAYVGKEKGKEIFLVETARRINKVYLKSISKKCVRFVWMDSQRLKAPKKGGRDGTAAGIAYHNGDIYCAYADEARGGRLKTLLVDKTDYKKFFRNKNRSRAIKFDYSYKKSFRSKFITESIFFTKQEGDDHVYVTCNGIGSGKRRHMDYIYKSRQKH